MSCAVNQATLSSDTDGGQNIVAGTHDVPDIGLVKFIDDLGGGRFQLVLEDNEPEKA